MEFLGPIMMSFVVGFFLSLAVVSCSSDISWQQRIVGHQCGTYDKDGKFTWKEPEQK